MQTQQQQSLPSLRPKKNSPDPILIQTDEWASQSISAWLYEGYCKNKYKIKPQLRPVFKTPAQAQHTRTSSRQSHNTFHVQTLDQPVALGGRSRSVQTGERDVSHTHAVRGRRRPRSQSTCASQHYI